MAVRGRERTNVVTNVVRFSAPHRVEILDAEPAAFQVVLAA
ncbi:hypothetical protein [Demetria terragena]|nr:hypothetical protein [Demetria terragena]